MPEFLCAAPVVVAHVGKRGIPWSAPLRGIARRSALGQPGDGSPVLCALKIQLDRAVRAAWEAGGLRCLPVAWPGGAMYFAEAVLRLQEQGADLSLEAWVPCPEQPGRWPEADQVRYRALLTRCGRVHVVEPAYTPGCMLRRNQAIFAGRSPADQRLRWNRRWDRRGSGLCQGLGAAGGCNLAVISRAFPGPGPRHWPRCR